MQVVVRDNNVDQALRVLKKKMQREGVFREMKQRRAYEKPSERKAREKSEAIRRARKLARKQAIREGLLPAPPKKKLPERKPSLPRTSASAGWGNKATLTLSYRPAALSLTGNSRLAPMLNQRQKQ
jgi:small subunit ribosomal protein S21